MAREIILNEALERVGAALVQQMKQEVAVDTGKLRDSIDYYVKDNILYITMEDYGVYVDEGRAPGKMPPIKSIEGWAKRKGLNPWAVATNISKYGTRPQPFMTEFNDFERKYFRMLEDGLYDEIDNMIDKIIKNNK